MPTLRLPTRCPCGSGATYAECCGELHRGRNTGGATALTAEQLMRSRFSAFAVGDVQYLLASWHPSTRPASLVLSTDVEFRRLEILDATAGSEADRAGTVEFVAHFWDAANREHGLQRENSAFVQVRSEWFYVGPAA